MNRFPRACWRGPLHAFADGVAGIGTRMDSGESDAADWDTLGERVGPDADGTGEQKQPALERVVVEAPSRDRTSVQVALQSILVDFERLLAGKSRETLAQASNDGGWGMVEIIPHLRDWEEIFHLRVNRILTEDVPLLERFDDSLWSIEHDYPAQDPIKVFAQFKQLRSDLAKSVAELDDEAWLRTAVLDGIGEITLHWLLNDICNRDATQVSQARDLIG